MSKVFWNVTGRKKKTKLYRGLWRTCHFWSSKGQRLLNLLQKYLEFNDDAGRSLAVNYPAVCPYELPNWELNFIPLSNCLHLSLSAGFFLAVKSPCSLCCLLGFSFLSFLSTSLFPPQPFLSYFSRVLLLCHFKDASERGLKQEVCDLSDFAPALFWFGQCCFQIQSVRGRSSKSFDNF